MKTFGAPRFLITILLILFSLWSQSTAVVVSLPPWSSRKSSSGTLENTCQCDCCYSVGKQGRTECLPPIDTSFDTATCTKCSVEACEAAFPVACAQPSSIVTSSCIKRNGWMLRLVPVLFLSASFGLLLYACFIKKYDGYHDDRVIADVPAAPLLGGPGPRYDTFRLNYPDSDSMGGRSATTLPPIAEHSEVAPDPEPPQEIVSSASLERMVHAIDTAKYMSTAGKVEEVSSGVREQQQDVDVELSGATDVVSAELREAEPVESVTSPKPESETDFSTAPGEQVLNASGAVHDVGYELERTEVQDETDDRRIADEGTDIGTPVAMGRADADVHVSTDESYAAIHTTTKLTSDSIDEDTASGHVQNDGELEPDAIEETVDEVLQERVSDEILDLEENVDDSSTHGDITTTAAFVTDSDREEVVTSNAAEQITVSVDHESESTVKDKLGDDFAPQVTNFVQETDTSAAAEGHSPEGEEIPVVSSIDVDEQDDVTVENFEKSGQVISEAPVRNEEVEPLNPAGTSVSGPDACADVEAVNLGSVVNVAANYNSGLENVAVSNVEVVDDIEPGPGVDPESILVEETAAELEGSVEHPNDQSLLDSEVQTRITETDIFTGTEQTLSDFEPAVKVSEASIPAEEIETSVVGSTIQAEIEEASAALIAGRVVAQEESSVPEEQANDESPSQRADAENSYLRETDESTAVKVDQSVVEQELHEGSYQVNESTVTQEPHDGATVEGFIERANPEETEELEEAELETEEGMNLNEADESATVDKTEEVLQEAQGADESVSMQEPDTTVLEEAAEKLQEVDESAVLEEVIPSGEEEHKLDKSELAEDPAVMVTSASIEGEYAAQVEDETPDFIPKGQMSEAFAETNLPDSAVTVPNESKMENEEIFTDSFEPNEEGELVSQLENADVEIIGRDEAAEGGTKKEPVLMDEMLEEDNEDADAAFGSIVQMAEADPVDFGRLDDHGALPSVDAGGVAPGDFLTQAELNLDVDSMLYDVGNADVLQEGGVPEEGQLEFSTEDDFSKELLALAQRTEEISRQATDGDDAFADTIALEGDTIPSNADTYRDEMGSDFKEVGLTHDNLDEGEALAGFASGNDIAREEAEPIPAVEGVSDPNPLDDLAGVSESGQEVVFDVAEKVVEAVDPSTGYDGSLKTNEQSQADVAVNSGEIEDAN